ncbi:MAG: sigma-54 dependent transcriptional regulator [Acidobacteria bacterium]|nr:sigma-54 dependent transcriptional regulator [Acidobacteriota bacterium]
MSGDLEAGRDGARAPRVLLVDADAALRESLQRVLQIDGYEAAEAASSRVALESFRAARPDLTVLAAQLPDGSAIDLLRELRKIDPASPCIVLARYEDLELAALALQEGAEQFLTKPVQIPAFLLVVDRVLDNARNRRRALREETRSARERIDPFRGTGHAIRLLAERARRVADASAPILIHGETGTGKGILAAWLHRNGSRSEECFLDLNCAGLSPEFLESELFGHEKGAFTGAVAAKLGLLEVAHRGTLFLDEIGDVPLSVQPKLLKVLEEKKFRRLGDVRERQVDIRLIAASHENLAALVEKKRFRADLYFRINTVVLEIPPLRERPEDVPDLALSLLEDIGRELGRDPLRLAPASVERLAAYAWPGNVRELRNVLERAALLSHGGEIGAAELGFEAPATPDRAARQDLSLLETEKDLIRRALRVEGGRVEKAAHSLGISRSSLYQKIRKYGLAVSRS